MRLTNDQKDAARRLLALTETKQFTLSMYSKLSPSVVSEMTNPGRERDIQPETWRKFIDGLEQVVREFKAKSASDQAKAEVERLFGDVMQEEEAPLLQKGDFLQDPGGWIASNAKNYIVRQIDRALERYLDRNVGAMVVVQGAAQSGRSSAVRRLADQAIARGFAADVIDFQDFVNIHRDSGWTAEKAVRWVFEELGIEAPKTAFPRAEFGSDAGAALLRGLEVRTQRVSRAFLIIDSFDVLSRSVADKTEEDLLVRWLSFLRSTMPMQPPFDRLTMVVVANAPHWAMDSAMSNFISHARPLTTGKLNDDEVQELFVAYDLGGEAAQLFFCKFHQAACFGSGRITLSG